MGTTNLDALAVDSIAVNSAPGIVIGGYDVPTLNSFGDGTHVLQVAMATFDAGIVANRSIAAHGLGVTLPIHSIVVGGVVDVHNTVPANGAKAGGSAVS